jgi:2-oxo-4-hydroxy-4-carboxy-5-ureidoimidazoline decarboxylase
MTRRQPFESETALFDAAEAIWRALAPSDWLEAFASHPRIGERGGLRAKFAATSDLSAREQAGALGAPDDIRRQLAEENVRYEQRFGFIFIVCATGKTAEEMLTMLRRRLSNTAGVEIEIAAAEQLKITRIRLEQLAP